MAAIWPPVNSPHEIDSGLPFHETSPPNERQNTTPEAPVQG